MTSSDKPTVALLGTGIMGSAMVRRLLQEGFPVTVWNRTSERARPLERAGARLALDLVEAVSESSVVITMLADGPAVIDVMIGSGDTLAAMPEGTLWLQMSTVGVRATEQLMRAADEHGVTFVDAPVLGTKQPAEKGELVVLAAGASRSKEAAQSVFDAVAKKTFWLGPAPLASKLKLVTNTWVVGLLGVIAETIAVAESLEVNPEQFLDAIAGGPLDCGYAHIKSGAMMHDELDPSFPLRLALKDVGLVLQQASSNGGELRITRALAEHLNVAMQRGFADADMAAVIKAIK